MKGKMPEKDIRSFQQLYAQGCPAPDRLKSLKWGPDTWNKKDLVDAMKKLDEEMKILLRKDRFKNNVRNCQTPPVSWEALEAILWPDNLQPLPETFVEELKVKGGKETRKLRVCGDFSRPFQGGESPNDLIPDEECAVTGTGVKDLATLTLACNYVVTADVCNAFRNLIAHEDWWRFQVVPVEMADGKIGWSLAYTLEFGKRNASALWVHFYKMVCRTIELRADRNL